MGSRDVLVLRPASGPVRRRAAGVQDVRECGCNIEAGHRPCGTRELPPSAAARSGTRSPAGPASGSQHHASLRGA